MITKRIGLVGSSSTGKSTVFELLKLKLPTFDFVNQSSRTVASYGFTINENGGDLTQLAISSFHLEALLTSNKLVLDRCYLDLVVYTDNLPNITPEVSKYILDTWKRVKSEYTHFVYFPIEFPAVDDGQRSVNEEWRSKIDNTFQEYLKKDIKNYLTVTGSPKQRIDQILNYIN